MQNDASRRKSFSQVNARFRSNALVARHRVLVPTELAERPRLSALVDQLARSQDAELVAVRIGEDDPRHIALTDVDRSCTERDQSIDLGPLITVDLRCDVDVDAALRRLVRPGRSEREERPGSVGSADRDVAVLVIDDRPPDGFAPEVPGRRMSGLEHHRAEETSVSEEIASQDDAELVAFGI